jgi:27-O-demethylrifamycin SV methyltransferase
MTDERDLRGRYEAFYSMSQSELMRSIAQRACGCAFGAMSWTTREQADEIGGLLDLRPGQRLLDVGAGSGWPGLYLAKISGCDVALADLPLAGLRIASDHAARYPSPGRCWVAVADGARLPFGDGAFDAVSHGDVLCCLPAKRAVLQECRRVLRGGGRMAFTIIFVPAGLAGEDHRRGVESGPEFIETETDYPTLLDETGWALCDRIDVSAAYQHTCREILGMFIGQEKELAEFMGASAYGKRRAKLAAALEAIEHGWQRREILMTSPISGRHPPHRGLDEPTAASRQGRMRQ